MRRVLAAGCQRALQAQGLVQEAAGQEGRHDVIVSLQNEGTLLQFRTMQLSTCNPSAVNLNALPCTLATLNYTLRFIKFGWDASDGEVVGHGDAWLMDLVPTDQQFERMVRGFLLTLDSGHRRIQAVVENGQDPGDEQPAPSRVSGSTEVPDELRELLERLRGQEQAGEGGEGQSASG